MISSILLALAAAAPSTADLGFMIGEWRLEGAFNPGTPQERRETGTRSCAFAMTASYVRCDWRMTDQNGRTRELISYHNYNALYARFEHLFVASNWPTKVIGSGTLFRDGARTGMAIDIRFTLPDGRTEEVRARETHEADRFESLEEIRVTDGGEARWRTNYRLVGTRVAARQ